MTAVEYANKVCDFLNGRSGYYSTPHLAREIGVADTSRDTLIKVLDKLHLCGVLSKFGSGKFRWKLAVTEWDRYDPFKVLPTYTPPQESTSYAPIPPVEQTFDPSADPTLASLTETVTRVHGRIDRLETKVHGIDTQVTWQTEVLTAIRSDLALMEDKIGTLGGAVKRLEVKRWDGKVTALENVVLPKVYKKVLDLVSMKRNVLLVGPAGCGKTYLAELIARSLNLQFGAMSCTAGISEAHLLGRGVPNLTKGENVFQGTSFLDCFEGGGVFLFDELDASDPNFLLSINSALANGYVYLTHRRKKHKAERHADFRAVATANTFGRGQNRLYAGRNQLDEATIDRFRIGIVECHYDEAVEAAVCPDPELRGMLTRIRQGIERAGVRRVMSTRFMEDAYVMKAGAGWTDKDILDTFLQGWTDEEKSRVLAA